ncbi:hypothetical protein IMSAGC003_03397 [Lachnospiraceae bacterium]|nr:ATP-binding protein [Acetatifactor sp.]GFH96831.1 hypothetical protein IMSAGC003_03397 [Lachnospiraceae bacterium]
MLISYKFKNFCSFSDEAEFDLLAPGNKVKHRFPDNYVETEAGYDLLKTAVVVGENAGGKTNFISSLSFFKSLFANNERVRTYKGLVNFNTLKEAGDRERYAVQEFDIQVMSKTGGIYHYHLAIDGYSIVKEMFSSQSAKSNQEKMIMSVTRKELDTESKKGAVRVMYEVMLDNCSKEIEIVFERATITEENLGLFVARLAILGEPRAQELVGWVNSRLNIENQDFNYSIYKELQNTEEDINIIRDPRFLDILRMVDYSIEGIEIDEEKPFSASKIVRVTKDGQRFSRELKRDSGGVREFFAWAVQLFRVVYEDKVVFADEMDRVINPILAERMISFINGKKHRGQFIFSSHNVLHLDLKNYMKEQIYFVTKDRDSLNSELYSLADFPDIRYETTKIYEFYMKGILGGTAFE